MKDAFPKRVAERLSDLWETWSTSAAPLVVQRDLISTLAQERLRVQNSKQKGSLGFYAGLDDWGGIPDLLGCGVPVRLMDMLDGTVRDSLLAETL